MLPDRGIRLQIWWRRPTKLSELRSEGFILKKKKTVAGRAGVSGSKLKLSLLALRLCLFACLQVFVWSKTKLEITS